MTCSSWRALQGACPPTESQEEPRCGMEKPLGHRQSPEGKGKEKGGGGGYPCHSAHGSHCPSPALCNLSFLETKLQSMVSRGLS